MLTQKQLKIIKEIIFSRLDPNRYSVFIFGSRSIGINEKFSDIDIGIEGPTLPIETKIDIEDAFEISDLPYRVDVVDFSMVSSKFKQVAKQNIIAL
jgi:predicted nucleotidyltransferase